MKHQPDSPLVRTTEQRGFISDTPKGELAKAGGPDITHLLAPGEQVVWQGQSGLSNIKLSSGLFRRSDQPTSDIETKNWLLFFGGTLIVVGVVIPILYALISQSISAIYTFPIMALLIAIGAAMIGIGRRISDGLSYYWLTNHHAIIVRKVEGSSDYTTTMIDLANTDAVKMTERADGSGTLVFGRNAASAYSPTTRSYVSDEADYSFSDIPNVAEVYRLVQELQAAARQPS